MALLRDVRGLFRRRHHPVEVDISGTQAERLAEALHTVGASEPDSADAFAGATTAPELVPELIRKVGGHLEEQADRHERLLQLLGDLPGALHALPETVRRNASVHEDLHQHIVQLAAREDAIREAVDRVHATAARQTDVLGLVQTNLETGGESLARVHEAIGELHRALAAVAETNRGTAEALSALVGASAAREAQLARSLLGVQRWAIVVAACCGAGLIGAVVVAMVALGR
jgi:DNA-binding ferritin-like protein